MAARRDSPQVTTAPALDGTLDVFLDGVRIGWVSRDRQQYTSPRTPEHYFRIFQGFGLSTVMYSRLWGIGVKMVRIVYQGRTGRYVWASSLSDWLPLYNKAQMYHKPGYDAQYVLSTGHMTLIESPDGQPPAEMD